MSIAPYLWGVAAALHTSDCIDRTPDAEHTHHPLDMQVKELQGETAQLRQLLAEKYTLVASSLEG
jgi:hypothetical protein